MLETEARMRYEREEVWFPCSEDLLGWDDDFHTLMLKDHIRMEAYRAAIAEAVEPGMTVLDLGTGTGILARWALEAGAERVYGIDVNDEILATAVAELTRAGFGNRFVPINELSFDIELPATADLLISEILGNLADNENCVEILVDARERLLAPGGRMLPLGVTSLIAPVAAERAHEQVRRRACRGLNERYSLSDLLARLELTSPFNLYYDVILPADGYLSELAALKEFDFTRSRPETVYQVRRVFPVRRDGTFTGFKGCFRSALTENVTLDISGDDIAGRETSDSWKHCYLPIEIPIEVAAGDEIVLDFDRSLPRRAGSPFSKCYTWQGEVRRNGHTVEVYHQSMEESVTAVAVT